MERVANFQSASLSHVKTAMLLPAHAHPATYWSYLWLVVAFVVLLLAIPSRFIEKCPIRRKTSSAVHALAFTCTASFSNYVIWKWKITSHLQRNWITKVIKLWTGKLHLFGFSLSSSFCWFRFLLLLFNSLFIHANERRRDYHFTTILVLLQICHDTHKHRAHHIII